MSIENATSTAESNPMSESLSSFLAKFNLKMFVYDYDRGFLSDDLIGYADIELESLRENV